MTIVLTRSRVESNSPARFQSHLAGAALILLVLSIAGCILTGIHVDAGKNLGALAAVSIPIAVLAIYWRDQNRPARLDSILVIPWIILLIPMLAFPMLIAARLRLPLQDTHLARIDHLFGVYVPSIASWARGNTIGSLISKTYSLLIYLLILAALVPALAGKLKRAREFVVANLVAIALGMPLFALLPAVGPWYAYHLHPSADQAFCQAQLFLLRVPGPYHLAQGTGVICFPSFHVIWAILCAYALWDFRFLRLPAMLLSFLIILSTMTTGWHYFSDVLGGVIIGVVAIVASRAYTRRANSMRQSRQTDYKGANDVP